MFLGGKKSAWRGMFFYCFSARTGGERGRGARGRGVIFHWVSMKLEGVLASRVRQRLWTVEGGGSRARESGCVA